MTYAELTRKLKKLGCQFRRRAKGGHEIWWHPERKGMEEKRSLVAP